jgi:hypothetical protein
MPNTPNMHQQAVTPIPQWPVFTQQQVGDALRYCASVATSMVTVPDYWDKLLAPSKAMLHEAQRFDVHAPRMLAAQATAMLQQADSLPPIQAVYAKRAARKLAKTARKQRGAQRQAPIIQRRQKLGTPTGLVASYDAHVAWVHDLRRACELLQKGAHQAWRGSLQDLPPATLEVARLR